MNYFPPPKNFIFSRKTLQQAKIGADARVLVAFCVLTLQTNTHALISIPVQLIHVSKRCPKRCVMMRHFITVCEMLQMKITDDLDVLNNFYQNDDVIKRKHFPRYWPFVRGIHRWPVNTPTPKRPVTRRFDAFFDLRLNKRLSKKSRCRWFVTSSRSLWCHCNDKSKNWVYSLFFIFVDEEHYCIKI